MAGKRMKTADMIRSLKKNGYRTDKVGHIAYFDDGRPQSWNDDQYLSSEKDAGLAREKGAPDWAVRLIGTYPHTFTVRSRFAWALERHMLFVETIGDPDYERLFLNPSAEYIYLDEVEMYDRCMSTPCENPVKALMNVGAERMMRLHHASTFGYYLHIYHTNRRNVMSMGLDVAVRRPGWFDEYLSIVQSATDHKWPEDVPITRKYIMEYAGLPKAFIIENAKARSGIMTSDDYMEAVREITKTADPMLKKTRGFMLSVSSSKRERALSVLKSLASEPTETLQMLGFAMDGGILSKPADIQPARTLRILETALRAGDDGLYRWAVFRACERRLEGNHWIGANHTIARECEDYIASGTVPAAFTYTYGVESQSFDGDDKDSVFCDVQRDVESAIYTLNTMPKTLDGYRGIAARDCGDGRSRCMDVDDYVGPMMKNRRLQRLLDRM